MLVVLFLCARIHEVPQSVPGGDYRQPEHHPAKPPASLHEKQQHEEYAEPNKQRRCDAVLARRRLAKPAQVGELLISRIVMHWAGLYGKIDRRLEIIAVIATGNFSSRPSQAPTSSPQFKRRGGRRT